MSLNIAGITAGYGGVPVLHGIDLTVGENECVGIVGANGAGKSTLVRTICGLSPAMSGHIRMDGVDITQTPAHRRLEHGLAVVLEERSLFPELSVRDNLRLSESAGRRVERNGREAMTMDEVLTLFPAVGERLSSRVELLSGGQQQMVCVARALLLQPRLMVLDELTTGLAPKIVREILGTLTHLRKRGLSILVVEQSVALAAEMTDRAYVLSVGKVVRQIARTEWPAVLADQSLTQAYLHG